MPGLMTRNFYFILTKLKLRKESKVTSYSTARMTAEAAKLLQKDPDLTAAQLREKLLGSAQSLPDGRKYIP